MQFIEYNVSDPDVLGDYFQAYWTDFFFRELLVQSVRDYLGKNTSYYSGELFAKTAFYNGSGQFGCIYRLQSANGQDLPRVLKLYTREFPDETIQRQSNISATIRSWKIQNSEIGKYFVRYEYYSKGFQDLSDDPQIAPFLIMDLVRNAYPLSAEYLRGQDKGTIKKIADDFLNMMRLFDVEKVGYGDLSPGNILVTMENGEPHLMLVDYDDMYVPRMGWHLLSLECGKPAYQHKSRSQESCFPLDEKIHYFSSIVYYLTLLVLSLSKEVYQKRLDAAVGDFNDLGILFTASDLHDPENSALFSRLKNDSNQDVRFLASMLYEYATSPDTEEFESLPQLLEQYGTYSSKELANLGISYWKGKGVVQDKKKAISYFRKSAILGSMYAQFNLGLCYANGEGVEKNLEKAAYWYEKAAVQGNADAQTNLGLCYESGSGVVKDLVKAAYWYEKAAVQGYALAQHNLGFCYQYGRGVAKDLAKAVELYRKASEQGSASAQTNLGWCYENGEGVEKNLEKAVAWYRKAAEKGSASAQHNLGFCYQYGRGVAKDLAKAVEWYQKASEQGYASAQNNLGVRYENGEGVEKNLEKAVAWYRKAAEQGNVHAQTNLGWCYKNGKGVEKNLEKAAYWCERAAVQGYARAQFNLGWCYENGEGVEKNLEKAAYWYEKAAVQGNTHAQTNLGLCYEYGRGVAKDLAKAVEWYRKAAEQGDADAKQKLKDLT